MLRIKRFVYWY